VPFSVRAFIVGWDSTALPVFSQKTPASHPQYPSVNGQRQNSFMIAIGIMALKLLLTKIERLKPERRLRPVSKT
jgi:hypothetical protein